MANRDFKKIERTIKDFSLNVGGGSGTSNKVNVTFEAVPGGGVNVVLDKTNDEIIEMLKNGVVTINGNMPATTVDTAIFNALILSGSKDIVDNVTQYQFALLNAGSDFELEYNFSEQKWVVSTPA